MRVWITHSVVLVLGVLVGVQAALQAAPERPLPVEPVERACPVCEVCGPPVVWVKEEPEVRWRERETFCLSVEEAWRASYSKQMALCFE